MGGREVHLNSLDDLALPTWNAGCCRQAEKTAMSLLVSHSGLQSRLLSASLTMILTDVS